MPTFVVLNSSTLKFSPNHVYFSTYSEADKKARELADQYVGIVFHVYEQKCSYGHERFSAK